MLPLFLLLFLYSSSLSTADDGPAILKLAAALRPTPRSWSTKSSSGFCKWNGVTCDSSSSVISLDLSSMSISGTIPTFDSFTSLQRLTLSENNFSSVSPGAFYGLANLQALSLSKNYRLDPWNFPDLTKSTALVNLSLDNTSLYGPLPDFFGSFTSLERIRISYNNLTSSLPPSFAGSSIKYLWINNQQNGFTGTIDVLSQMTSLEQAWLQVNQFTGPIPDFSKCTSLYDLQLRDNQFTGPIPQSLISLPSLQNVSLSNNKMQGPLPKLPPNVQMADIDRNNNYCADAGDPCDPNVTIMLEIAGGFGYPVVLSDAWQGNDACKFASVSCDAQGSIINVNLGKRSLVGTISSAFGNLTSLKNLNLNDNKLTGSIPDSLTKLDSLQLFDVSNNNLSGKIPTFSNKVKFVYTGNPFLGKIIDTGGGGGGGGSGSDGKSGGGGSSSGGRSKRSLALIIVFVVIGIIILLVALGFLSYKYYKKKKYGKFGKPPQGDEKLTAVAAAKTATVSSNDHSNEMQSKSTSGDRSSDPHVSGGGNVVISIEVLREVTNNFGEDNVLGRGGFGVVYKGELHDGTKIAVKRMESSNISNKGMKEFQAEIAVLTNVRHRHLVGLLGYCINGNERLLVYEYMPQGTLGQHLFEWREHGYSPLTWKQRVTTALDVARGVEYLHSLAHQSFIHRDLKPSNVLLGDDMRAKVSDFGLVKNAPDGKHSVETKLAGTFGYLAPEYAATGRVTTKVDVYAFGVILMELITGRKALEDSLPDDKSHLVTWFRRMLINKDKIEISVDEILKPDEDTMASITKVAELAGHCTAREPHQRPDMGHAVNVLGPLVEQWRPESSLEDDDDGIDLHISLPQALQKWQADHPGATATSGYDYTSSSLSQSSIPPRPPGFQDTFTSSDGR